MRLVSRRLLGAAILLGLCTLAPAQAQSYTQSTITPAFVDISTTGTALPLVPPGNGDAISAAVAFPAGFTFSHFGVPKTGFRVSSEGFLTFDQTFTSTSNFTNVAIPTAGTPNSAVFPYWDDLSLRTTPTASGVRFQYDSPNARLIVQWNQFTHFGATAAVLAFQAQLYTSGVIEFHYQTLTSNQLDYTVGIENDNGTAGNQTYFGTSATIAGTGTLATTTNAFRYTFVAPTPPVCATLVSPADGATGVSYGATTFSWTAPTTGGTPTGYLLDVGTTLGGTQVVNGTNVGNVTSVTLRNGTVRSTQYYWSVRPTNGAGTASGCASNGFTTAGATPVVAGTPFSQDFAATLFPPPNWTFFDNGIGLAQSWSRNTGGFAQSNFETVGAGLFAIDYFATPALTIPAAGATLTFKNWQGSSGASTYRVLVSTGGQFPASAYQPTPLASWSNAVSCTGTGATPTIVPTTPNCSFSLNAFAGQTVHLAFVHENNNGFNMFIDDVVVTAVATTPVFSLSPATTVTLGAAGFCTTPTTRTTTFTVTNTGAGTLQVTGAAVTGGTGFTVSTASLPASLTAGQSVAIPVTFTPAFGQTAGAQSTAFTVNYNDGTAQTSAPVTVNATVDASNPAVSSALTNTSGIAFRNSAAGACTAGSTVTAPGTAFVGATVAANAPPPGTRLAGFLPDEDDGFVDLPAAVLDAMTGGSFRLFGQTFETLRVTTNGNVMFANAANVLPAYSALSDRTVALPTTLLGTVVSGAGHDYEITAADYAADNLGVGGTPGVWVGTADVDGDTDLETVITFWHLYDFGSLTEYASFQMILHDGGAPNVEDRVEMRYFAGLDGNGIAYRANTTDIENSAAVGISPAYGLATSEYRDNSSTGGQLFGAASIGVTFQPETQATAQGGVGYRMMGVPIATGAGQFTVGRLAGMNLVQGVNGQYPTFGDNLYTSYTGTIPAPPQTNYVPAADIIDVLTPGQGFFWRLYNITFDPTTGPNPSTDGTSQSYALPMPLQATGVGQATAVTRALVPFSATNDGFSMLANPFRGSLDISAAQIGTWTGGGGVSNVFQTFDPSNGSYVLPMNLPTPDVLAPWQGFWVENNTSTSLVIPTTAQTTGGTFVGRSADSTAVALAFRLDGTVAGTGEPTTDVAAALAVVAENAGDGWDTYDASKLAPLSEVYATVAFQGERGGEPRLKAQESRAADAASFSVPLVVDAVGTAPTLTLSWAGIDALPPTWALELRDLETGTTVDLRTASSYAFEMASTPARALSPDAIVARTTTAGQSRASDDARFVLHVTAGAVATEPGVPMAYALAAPAPNPTSGDARIAYDVPAAATVSVVVYDLLGRRVAVLAQGEAAAGRHTVRLDARAFAPGVYVVRMTAGGGAGAFSATQRVTVVR